MTRMVLYVAAPLGAPDRAGLEANLARAMRWLSWLRRSFPETTFIAPWIAAVLGGEDDADPDRADSPAHSVVLANGAVRANKAAGSVVRVPARTQPCSILKSNSSSPRDRSPTLKTTSISPMFEQIASTGEPATGN